VGQSPSPPSFRALKRHGREEENAAEQLGHGPHWEKRREDQVRDREHGQEQFWHTSGCMQFLCLTMMPWEEDTGR
jgi:hypothetical protein